jgi:hypothetical protein
MADVKEQFCSNYFPEKQIVTLHGEINFRIES